MLASQWSPLSRSLVGNAQVYRAPCTLPGTLRISLMEGLAAITPWLQAGLLLPAERPTFCREELLGHNVSGGALGPGLVGSVCYHHWRFLNFLGTCLASRGRSVLLCEPDPVAGFLLEG